MPLKLVTDHLNYVLCIISYGHEAKRPDVHPRDLSTVVYP